MQVLCQYEKISQDIPIKIKNSRAFDTDFYDCYDFI